MRIDAGAILTNSTLRCVALASEELLEPRFHDHKLRGEWKEFRECHIEPDWLLIYLVAGGEITFVRTGTHADLFDE